MVHPDLCVLYKKSDSTPKCRLFAVHGLIDLIDKSFAELSSTQQHTAVMRSTSTILEKSDWLASRKNPRPKSAGSVKLARLYPFNGSSPGRGNFRSLKPLLYLEYNHFYLDVV
jgi:hypothetical protein